MEGRQKILVALLGGFVAGTAAGGTGMFFYAKRYFSAQADERVKEMAAYYNDKLAAKKEDIPNDGKGKEESSKEEQTEKDAEVQSKYEAISDIYKSKEEQKEPTAYSNYFNDSKSDTLPINKKGSKKKKKVVDIEVVDDSVWDENPANLDTSFLIYYDADGALVNEESETLVYDRDDIVRLIESNEAVDGVLIIQDNTNKVLYHVTVEQSAYSEVSADV